MRIVCLGDSFTRGFMAPKKSSWCELLRAEFAKEEIEVNNRGLNGDTTAGMLSRFKHDVIDLKPKIVLITGGANDLFSAGSIGGQMALSNYIAMIHQAVHNGIMPVVGLQANYEGKAKIPDNFAALPYISVFNENAPVFYDTLKKTVEGMGYNTIDFRTPYREWAQGKSQEEMFVDGLHLNADGHMQMFIYAWQKFREILREFTY